MITNPNTPVTPQATTLTDQVADSANGAIRSAKTVATDTLERLSGAVDDARDATAPLVNRLTETTHAAARRVRDTSAQLRERALIASDNAVGYIKDEPIKAMLIAAATGAALMALVSLASRSRNRD